jgi:hypothetical protein
VKPLAEVIITFLCIRGFFYSLPYASLSITTTNREIKMTLLRTANEIASGKLSPSANLQAKESMVYGVLLASIDAYDPGSAEIESIWRDLMKQREDELLAPTDLMDQANDG